MSRGTILKCWLFLCCVTVSRQLSITELEVPAAVKAGQDVELKCRFDLEDERKERLVVKWWSIHSHGDSRTALYQRIDDDKPSKLPHVEVKKGELDTIILKDVTPLDSGTYECEVANNGEIRKHKDLVVYSPGSGPQLNVSLIEDATDADDVRIECQASDVTPAPDLIIKVNGNEATVSKIISGPSDVKLYSIVGNATASLYDAEGATITCELLYENPDVAHPPYTNTILYVSGAASTPPPEDATEIDATTETEQLEGSHGWRSGASWLLLMATPALAAALR